MSKKCHTVRLQLSQTICKSNPSSHSQGSVHLLSSVPLQIYLCIIECSLACTWQIFLLQGDMSHWVDYRNFRTISRGLYVVFGPGKVSCGLYKGRLICRRLNNKTGKDRFYCPRRCNYNTYATYRKSGRAQLQPDPRLLRLRLRCWWPQLYLFHVEHKAGNQRNHRKYRQHRTNCSAHERCLHYMHIAVARAPIRAKVWLVSNSTHHINTHLAKYSRVPA